MIVTKQKHDHNHDQNYANIIRKDLTDELRHCAVNFPNTKSSIIVDKVLEENEDFRHFFENQSFMPKKRSMLRTVQRARKDIRSPTVRFQILS